MKYKLKSTSTGPLLMGNITPHCIVWLTSYGKNMPISHITLRQNWF